MKIYLGADYRGFQLKKQLIATLRREWGENAVVDLGAFTEVEGDDFNEPAVAVAREVASDPEARGILICDSAHGMTMQANRFKGVRAAHCGSTESAKLAREHDDANILCMSAHFLDATTAENIADVFLDTEFEPLERRVRRIRKLDETEPKS